VLQFALGTDPVNIGRHPDSEIVLDDITVSRRHVQITQSADGYVASDMGSLNGTYVNRSRIESAVLGNGDELQVGKFKITFLTAAGE
jgi:pSer/pThr/pTyr-binding forkhead associated (FHA) protein